MTTQKTKPPVVAKQNGKNIELKLNNVRLSFVDVFEPIQGTDDKGNPTDRFYLSTNVLLDKNTEAGKAQIAAVRQAMKDARFAEWGDDAPVISADRLCLMDGEPIDPNTADPDVPGSGTRKARWEGYEGHMYLAPKRNLKAKTKEEAIREVTQNNPVQILGPRKTARDSSGNPIFPILKESDGLIYSGCWSDVIITVYAYNGTGKGGQGKNHPHRINASLEAIKFVRHDTPFGGKKVDAQNAFDEEEDDEYDDVPSSAPAVAGGGMDDDPLG